MKRPVILVHGGAWTYKTGSHAAYEAGCRTAAQAGWDILQAGGSALDAVEAAVNILEDDPTFDAGRGSDVNRLGEVEMDAIIMDGKTLNFGAVAAVQQVQYPISLARMVMDRTKHNLIVGKGAMLFAEEQGVPFVEPEFLCGVAAETVPDFFPHDTVGAVAMDAGGNLAVATSTGGTPGKVPGRVGDSPLVGSGAYADNDTAAAGATGWGEMCMRIVISKTACDQIAHGMDAQQAADYAINLLETRVGGFGGLIMVDKDGNIGLAHNTQDMSHAYIAGDGVLHSAQRRR